jgi:hypothetical protein
MSILSIILMSLSAFSVWTSAAEHCQLGAAAGQAGQHPQLPRRNVGWGEVEQYFLIFLSSLVDPE